MRRKLLNLKIQNFQNFQNSLSRDATHWETSVWKTWRKMSKTRCFFVVKEKMKMSSNLERFIEISEIGWDERWLKTTTKSRKFGSSRVRSGLLRYPNLIIIIIIWEWGRRWRWRKKRKWARMWDCSWSWPAAASETYVHVFRLESPVTHSNDEFTQSRHTGKRHLEACKNDVTRAWIVILRIRYRRLDFT